MEFERQSEIMDMKEEMMNDAIDDAMGDEDDEEERYKPETTLTRHNYSNNHNVERIFIQAFSTVTVTPSCPKSWTNWA